MNEPIKMMHALLHFCARYKIPPPAAVELRFNDEADAYNFEAAMLNSYDQSAYRLSVDQNRSPRIETVCGIPLHVTYQQFGSPYSVTMLPAHHPAVKRP